MKMLISTWCLLTSKEGVMGSTVRIINAFQTKVTKFPNSFISLVYHFLSTLFFFSFFLSLGVNHVKSEGPAKWLFKEERHNKWKVADQKDGRSPQGVLAPIWLHKLCWISCKDHFMAYSSIANEDEWGSPWFGILTRACEITFIIIPTLSKYLIMVWKF